METYIVYFYKNYEVVKQKMFATKRGLVKFLKACPEQHNAIDIAIVSRSKIMFSDVKVMICEAGDILEGNWWE